MFFILGSSGYIGSKFYQFLDMNERNVSGISRSEIDYTDPKTLKEFFGLKIQDF